MANIHIYLGIENIALNASQRQTLINELKALGPASNPQPARLNHWRTRLDNEAIILEALFNEANLTVAEFKQRLGSIFGIDSATIDHSTASRSFAGGTTPVVTFSRGGIDYLRFALFGGPGAAWMESGDECRSYLVVNRDKWELPELASTRYYVDATGGNDASTGLSPDDAWQTIAKINVASFNPIDCVLFKRGETWRETLTLPSNGVAGQPITFGVYGIGAKPIISAADVITTWTSYAGNTWQAALTTESMQVFIDDVNLTEGADRDSLNDHEWVWAANVLYVRDDTGDPDVTGVVIEATQRASAININDKNYITIQDIHATKNNHQWIGVLDDYDNTGATDRAGITIQDCEVSWGYWSGIRIDIDHADGVMDGVLVSGNYSHNNGGKGNGWGIALQGTGSGSLLNVQIYNNTTENNQDEGISFGQGTALIYENISKSDGLQGSAGIILYSSCINTKVFRNWIKNPNLEGIWCDGRTTTGLEIYSNVIFGGGAFGIQIDQVGDGTKIYNNTIYDMDGGIAAGITAQSMNIDIRNNLIDALNGSSGNVETRNSTTFTSDYNVWDEGKAFFPEDIWTPWADWVSVEGHDDNGYYEDAKMTNPSSEDFTLQSNSPARNAGTDVSLTQDYNGIPVPQETNPAIGAYEYVG